MILFTLLTRSERNSVKNKEKVESDERTAGNVPATGGEKRPQLREIGARRDAFSLR